MKKLFTLLTLTLLTFSSVFAYTSTQEDAIILSGLEAKVQDLYKTNPTKVDTVEQRLEKYLPLFKIDSREYYLLAGLQQIIMSVQNGIETNEVMPKIMSFTVVDGDTIEVFTTESNFTVRLLGIDAPESFDTNGDASKNALGEFIESQDITIKDDSILGEKYDDYGRRLAYIYVGSENINKKMIEVGMARELSYENDYQFSNEFKGTQSIAQIAELGIRAPENKCNQKRYCTEMVSCEEARYYLTECNVYQLDADEDGIPCESICL